MKILFLAHLVVPFVLVVEMTMRWFLPNTPTGSVSLMGPVEYTVLGIAAAWLIAGVGALRLQKEIIVKLMVSIYSTYIAVIVVFAVVPGPSGAPSLWPPNTATVLTPDPQYLPGLQGPGAFSTNSIGLRAPEWPEDNSVYTILAIGGSTTESLYLDDVESWPSLLMDAMPGAWVGNAGQSGRNAIDHVVLMETLPIVRDADLLLFMMGVNELQPAITFEGAETEAILQANGQDFRRLVENGGFKPSESVAALKEFKLYQAFVHSGVAQRMGIVPPSTEFQLGMGSGVWFEELRSRRRSADVVPMAELTVNLLEYQQRILRLDRLCEEYGVRCVFLTQPSLWRDDLTVEEERLLWLGWVDPLHQARGYVTAADMAEGMAAFNGLLMETCEANGMECYDLASAVPRTAENFYDDVHFTEEGSVLVAEWLARVLR